jgi:hypothetical protein
MFELLIEKKAFNLMDNYYIAMLYKFVAASELLVNDSF